MNRRVQTCTGTLRWECESARLDCRSCCLVLNHESRLGGDAMDDDDEDDEDDEEDDEDDMVSRLYGLSMLHWLM